MAYDTIMQQGRFTADGSNKTLIIRSDLDWIHIRNLTVLDAAGNDDLGEAYFQRGMTNGRGIGYVKESTIGALVPDQLAADTGFFLVNSTENVVSAAVAITSNTNATQSVFSVANTSGLATGSIIRCAGIAGSTSLNSFDFEVDTVVANTSFRMRYAMANAPGVGGTGGTYRIINFDPAFYPRRRFIVNISQAASAVVTTSVQHGYTVGQVVRMNVPAAFGMIEMNNIQATVTAITASTFTLDVDSSAFTAFSFALPADVPFSFATVTPSGENTGVSLANGLDILADATRDTSYIGVELVAGAASPAGQANDVIYWVAGKSFSVDNE